MCIFHKFKVGERMVKGLKIYIAKAGDTLRSIAQKNLVNLEILLSLNPQISNPDLKIAGIKVKIPSLSRIIAQETPITSDYAGIGSNVTWCPPETPEDFLEHWIPLTPLEKMAQTDYDVIIIGSGAGGGAVLWRLCDQWRNSGKRVAILEAGDLLLPTHALNLPTFDHDRLRRFLLNPKYMDPIGRFLPKYPGAKQFFALGGRTLHWGAVSPRLHPVDFRHLPIPYKDLIPYYLIAERIMNVNQGYTAGSFLQEILLRRLRSGGFPEAQDLPLAVDLEVTKFGRIHSNVFFSSIIFLAYALNLHPFDLAVQARAVQILHEGGKTTGVKVMTPDKKSYWIKGKTVVLSASSFESPRLLLYSGIRGEAIGRYLTNHSFTVATASTKREQFPEVLGVAGILIPRTEDQLFQLQVHGTDPFLYYWYHYKEKPLLKELKIYLQGFGIVESRYENYLTLDWAKPDEFGVPQLQIHFSYSERDQAIIRQMVYSIIQAASRMELVLDGTPCLMAPGVDQHESGTCRMGDDPSTSASNRYGQIHGVSGLYVADNSVLPSIGAANPTLTTVALAIRTADYIIEQWK